MPVTAKLSKKFYDVFGEAVTNELVEWFNSVDATCRSDLRELNELNFARFDAKLEQRATQLDAKIDQRTVQLETRVDQRIAEMKADMREGFARLEGAIKASSGDLRADLYKWMFGAWATLLGVMIALLRLH